MSRRIPREHGRTNCQTSRPSKLPLRAQAAAPPIVHSTESHVSQQVRGRKDGGRNSVGNDIGPISQDHVQVVAHHGVTEHIDAEDAGQLLHPAANPLLAMLKTAPAYRVLPAEIRPPRTAVDAVIDPALAFVDHLPSRRASHDNHRIRGYFGTLDGRQTVSIQTYIYLSTLLFQFFYDWWRSYRQDRRSKDGWPQFPRKVYARTPFCQPLDSIFLTKADLQIGAVPIHHVSRRRVHLFRSLSPEPKDGWPLCTVSSF